MLLTTARNGRANVMAMSWHMMVDFEPPLIARIASNRDHSFAALRASKECVIAIPPAELAEKVVAIGNCSGRDVDKFACFGLTTAKADHVAPPLIADCFANVECRAIDTRLGEPLRPFRAGGFEGVDRSEARKGEDHPSSIHHRGYGEFIVDGDMIRLPSKMP